MNEEYLPTNSGEAVDPEAEKLVEQGFTNALLKIMEGQNDQGAEDRMIVVSRLLQQAGLWSGKCEIWFTNPYMIAYMVLGIHQKPIDELDITINSRGGPHLVGRHCTAKVGDLMLGTESRGNNTVQTQTEEMPYIVRKQLGDKIVETMGQFADINDVVTWMRELTNSLVYTYVCINLVNGSEIYRIPPMPKQPIGSLRQ